MPTSLKQMQLMRGVWSGVDAALWLLPVVGALIGWVTNAIAVHMLFRPKRPLRVPLTKVFFQGVLPRRHGDLAKSVGRTVAEELLPVGELIDRLDVATMKTKMAKTIADHAEQRLETGFPRLLPHNLRVVLVTYLRDVVAREASLVLDTLTTDFRRRATEQLDVASVVTEKVLQLNLDELELLAHRIAGKELRAIIVLGAVIGFVIGVLQMFVFGVMLAP